MLGHILLCLAVAVLGALVYGYCDKASKAGELGRLAFFAGLLVTLLVAAHVPLKI